MRSIDNSEDIIDSRDVIARIEELESDRASLVDALMEAETADEPDPGVKEQAVDDARAALAEWDNGDDAEELKHLQALAAEASSSPDWPYGETLINDSYFQTYAEDLASDIYGRELESSKWPFSHIDWEAAADALKQDYSAVDFNGVTFWIRA